MQWSRETIWCTAEQLPELSSAAPKPLPVLYPLFPPLPSAASVPCRHFPTPPSIADTSAEVPSPYMVLTEENQQYSICTHFGTQLYYSCSQTLDNRTRCACAEFARCVYVIVIARELCACAPCPIISVFLQPRTAD